MLLKHILGCCVGFSFSFFPFDISDVEPVGKRHFPNTERENAVDPLEMNCKWPRSVERIHFLLREVMYLAAFGRHLTSEAKLCC